MEASHLLGWGRLLKTAGVMAFGLGAWLAVPELAWAGAGALAVAFALSGLGKVRHYDTLAISRRRRLSLSGSWVALSVVVLAFIWTYLRARFGAGGDEFWTLAVAGGGLVLVHYGLQMEYLGGLEADDQESGAG